MKLELYKDGRPFLNISAIGFASADDVVILPKNMIKGSTMSNDSFDNLYYSFTKDARTYEQAYEWAELKHEEWFETRKYSSFDSFRTALSKRIK